MGSSGDPSICACGNPAALLCGECRRGVCRLCVRAGDAGVEVCLACRSAAIERAEEHAAAARNKSSRLAASSARLRIAVTSSARLPASRVRKHLIFIPFAIVLVLAAMSAVAVPLFAEAREARAERRAESALRLIFVAEHAGSEGGKLPYLTLDELRTRRLLGLLDAPGYDLQLELARDRRKFWARAIPVQPGLRRLYVDASGEVLPEGE